MTDKTKLVGTFGVARMPLIGGPFDGDTRMGVIGAPRLVRVKPPKKKASGSEREGTWITFASWGGSDDEGEEWKKAQKAAKASAPQRYAVYAPRREGERWSVALYFIGTVDFAAPTPSSEPPK